MSELNFIAEFCCNHMGSLSYAKEMIDKLASAPENERINVIKFQKRTPSLCVPKENYNKPHPNPQNAFGETYGKHREFLEFSTEEHKELKKYIESKGLIYSCSIFDKNALEEILLLNPAMIKVGSANNIDYELLEILDKNFTGKKGIHISLGMTTSEEERQIIKSFKNQLENVVLYACTSAYPTAASDICLLEIERIKKLYGNEIMGIGFSGHHKGIYQDIAALTLGCTYFERHFTLDKSNKGTDQKIALEAEEFAQLIRAVKEVKSSLTYKYDEILDAEIPTRERLKFRG